LNDTGSKNRIGIMNSQLFLILLPAFFLLHNYNEVFSFMPLRYPLKYAAVIYSVMAIVYLVGVYFFKSRSKVALILFLLTLLFLFFAPLHGFVKNLSKGNFFGRYSFFLSLIFLLLIFLIWKIARWSAVSPAILHYLNLVMICLVGLEGANLAINYVDFKKSKNLIYSDKTICQHFVPSLAVDSIKPDIFLLVFDEYTASRTLQSLWHFDNHAIGDWLTGAGFYLPVKSNANYPCTFFSLPSMFNMNYLDPKKAGDATISKNILQGTRSFSDNETFCILGKEGYSIRYLAPHENKIEQNGLGNYFDFLVDHKLYEQTLFADVQRDLAWQFISVSQAQKNKEYAVNKLYEKVTKANKTIELTKDACKISTDRKPQFVYTHFMIPHEPNVFDSAGGFKPELLDFSNRAIAKTYPDQVMYANKVIRELVSFIKIHNKQNTIIVVMGDHGFKEYDSTLSVPSEYANFAAIYFPGQDYHLLYDHITPVNIFRIIFNQFFSQQLPLLKDSLVSVKLR